MTIALSLDHLSKTYSVGNHWFKRKKSAVKAVRNINLQVAEGETLGIVGESGCGKSTLARILVGLLEPTAGRVEIAGQPKTQADPAVFGRQIQYVFQDPVSSLNPRKSIRQTLEAPLIYLYHQSSGEREQHLQEVMQAVGLREDFLERYPHELSGGQAQRVGIARALLARPRILVLDEPVSALDVSVQAQVLNLLAELKQRYELTYLFISHDLAVVEAISQQVAVLYFGTVVEYGSAQQVFNQPRHPYTRLLASSAPVIGRPLPVMEKDAELPDPLNPPSGCAFASRCPHSRECCLEREPELQRLDNGQQVACYYPLEVMAG